MILKAVSDRSSLPLDGIVVDLDDGHELLQGYESDIVFLVSQETSKNVDSEDAQALTRFDQHDCTHAFRQNRVTCVLACFRVSRNLGKDVAHLVRSLRAALANLAEKLDDLNLQERILNSANLVLGSVAAHQQVLQLAVQSAHELPQPGDVAIIDPANLTAESHRGHQDCLVLIIHALFNGLVEVLNHIRNILDRPNCGKGSPHSNIG